MPGAGKAEVSRTAAELNFQLVVMGDIVREETKKAGLDPTPENVGHVMLQLREREGLQVIARRCIPIIQALPSRAVIVDGLRSQAEVHVLRETFSGFKVLCVHASPETRFRRLFGRGRSDDPANWKAFEERDERELSVGIASVIALADFLIVNEGTKNQLKTKVIHLLEHRLTQ
jgi:dephospho-CoA kinase